MEIEEVKEMVVSEDPVERAFALYMMNDDKLKSNKEIAEYVGINLYSLKNYIRSGIRKICNGKGWKALREDFLRSRAKEMIKAALPGMARVVSKGTEGLEKAIDLIVDGLNDGRYGLSDIPQVATKLITILERIVKIKRLEVGEATQNIDIHHNQIQDMSNEEAEDIATKGFLDV